MSFAALSPAALLAAALLTSPDREPAVRGTFITRLGEDVVAVESYTRSKRRLEGDIVLRVPGTTRYHYEVTFADNGTVKRSEFTIRPLGAPGVDEPRRLILDFGGESVRLNSIIRGESQRVTKPAEGAAHVVFLGGYGSSHGLYGSFGMYEHLLSLVRPGPEPSRFEALGADNGKRVTRFVKRPTETSAAVDYFKMAWTHLTLDEEGRILAADASGTTERTRTKRTEFTPVDPFEKEFLAVDRSGKGLGSASPNVEIQAKVGGASIVIKHGSPRLRGRTGVMKALTEAGTVWRTGANEATTLETSRDIVLGGVRVPAGKYSLWTQARGGTVELIVNREAGQWGTSYQAAQDLARTPLVVGTSESPLEAFMIDVVARGSGQELRLRWDTFVWSVAISEGEP